MDEATASVDPENEHLIQEAIGALTHGKTIITIAHRLATIQNADKILVVDGGGIAQQGTHGELIGQEGIYKCFIEIREKADVWHCRKYRKYCISNFNGIRCNSTGKGGRVGITVWIILKR